MNIISLLISFGLLMVAMSIHEFSHGWVAYKLGDTTAKYQGRLTLNPLAHIDIMGTIVLPLLLFMSTGYAIGAAKPVPINYWALKNPKTDMMWIGLAGPLSNIVSALILIPLVKISPQASLLAALLRNFIFLSAILGVFNLIPIPPLDGSRIIMGILPANIARYYASLEPFGFIIILVLMFLGIFNSLILPLVIGLLSLLGL